jgi:predicted nucleic acid-binding protein
MALILGDSSVWIDAMRRRPTVQAERLPRLSTDELVTTDAVVMEVLAGARSAHEVATVERALAAYRRIPTEQVDFDAAAAVYRACRRRGATPRSLVDCLIAAVAIRVDAAVLHSDRDFDLIAEHVELRIDRP